MPRLDSDRRYLIADERGSIVAVSNAAGAVIGVNAYDDYGQPGVSNLGRFQYTGQMWLTEAQLYHYKARAYLPALGRFAQTDPVLFAGGMNLYAYVGNDPVNATDPRGLQGEDTIVVTATVCRDEPGDNECPTNTSPSGDNCFFPNCVSDPQTIDALVDRFGTTVQQTGEDEITVTGRRRCDRACVTRQQEELRQWMQDNSLRLFGEFCQFTICAGVEVATGRGIFTAARLGLELKVSDRLRIAFFGNRGSHPLGRWPHYHRRPSNPAPPGQGIDRHRPWETRSPDTSFWDRF